jgi:hypothetical protein
MRVRDLQQFLSTFTASNKAGTRQGVKALGPLPPNTSPISMFHGSRIRELAACGLTLEACCLGLDACRLMLEQVGSKA